MVRPGREVGRIPGGSTRFVLHLLLLGAVTLFASPPPQVKVVPAAQMRHVPGIVVYEKTVKVMFLVEMREIYEDVAANSSVGNNTGNLRGLILEDIYKDVLHLHTTHPHFDGGHSRPKRQVGLGLAFAGGYALHSLFSSISSRLFSSDHEVLKYVNELRNSVGEVQKSVIVSQEKTMKFAENVQKIVSRIEYKTKSEIEGVVDLLRLKIYRDWLMESRAACSARTIPSKLVTHSDLISRLGKLESSLKTVNATLAISLKDIYSYYKLPIVDCVITESSFVVILNVPIRGSRNKWELFEISHTKFAFQKQTCHIYPTDSNYIAKSSEKTVVITANMMPHCIISQYPLCLVPEYTRDSSESLGCAVGLLEDRSLVELRKVCAFRCTSNQELIVQENTESSITLTNVESIQIMCPDHQKEFFFEKLGAIHIEMTCGCQVVVDFRYTIRPPLFCKDSFSRTVNVVRITPNLWSRLETATGFAMKLYSDHNNETLNEDWPQLIPVLNLSTPSFTAISNDYFISGISYIDIWLIVLSFVACAQTIVLITTGLILRA